MDFREGVDDRNSGTRGAHEFGHFGSNYAIIQCLVQKFVKVLHKPAVGSEGIGLYTLVSFNCESISDL